MPQYFDFEVALLDLEPRIWRRFHLAVDGTTFLDLHAAIQDADTWLNMHLWQFRDGRPGRVLAATPSDYEMGFDDLDSGPPADEVALTDVFENAGQACLYLYDFGDGWEHEVVLKQIVENPETFYRRLVGGERAFPPEDCGGPPGYELCVALTTPDADSSIDFSYWDAEEIEERREWIGDWDLEEFNLEAAKEWFDGESRRELAEKQEAILDELDDDMDQFESEEE